MPVITKPKLTLKKDQARKLVQVRVTVSVHTSRLDRAMFQVAPDERWYRVKCKLYGADMWPNQDNVIYVMSQRFYIPGDAIKERYDLEFEDTVGYDVLDEDVEGRDEIYARTVLYSYLTQQNTNSDSDEKSISV